MARIPVFQPQIPIGKFPPSGQRATGAAFGAQAGVALQQAGAAVERVGVQFEQEREKQRVLLERKQERENLIKETELLTGGNIELLQRIEQRKTQSDGTDFVDETAADIDKFTQEAIAAAPPESKERLTIRFLNMKSGLLKKSIGIEAGLKAQTLRSNFETLTNNATNLSREMGDIDASQNLLLEPILDQIDSFPLNKAQKDQLKQTATDDIFKAAFQPIIEANPAAALDALEEENFSQRLSSDTFNSITNAAENEFERKRLELNKLRETDQVEFALRSGVPNTPEALKAFQKKLGTPDFAISLLSKKGAKIMATNMNNLESSQQYTIFFDKLKQTYGEDLPIVMRDLAAGGMKEEIKLVTQMDPIEDAEVMETQFDVINSGINEVKGLARDRMAASGVDEFTTFEQTLTTTLDPLFTLILQEGASSANAAQMREQVIGLASARYNKTGDAEEAIAHATDWISNGFSIATINRRLTRIPAGYDTDLIEFGMREVIKKAKIGALSEDEALNEVITRLTKETAGFNMTVDGKNAIAVDVRNEPLIDENGEIIQISFKELEEFGELRREIIQEKREKRRKEIKEKFKRAERILFAPREEGGAFR